ncbi:dicarboxylate/amino acid:cation symporter [Candidatus Cardinium hertigii]|uniref:dicarboxylate/amino acid:cation symporter n=1 Tax=Candidatus Cardinium hertigii TaxID=247481 RepID=UPI003D7D980F
MMIIIYFLVIVLSIITTYFDFFILQKIAVLITQIFTKIFQFISLPVITLSMVVTISQHNEVHKMKHMWKRLLLYTIGTTIIAATITAILYCIIKPSHINMSKNDIIQPCIPKMDYQSHFMSLIPSNIFSPFIENNVIGALFLSIIMGIAIQYISDEKSRNIVICFFKGLHEMFLKITFWVMKMIPLALFGFATSTIMQLRNGIHLTGLTKYLSIIILANLIQGLIILPLFLYVNKIKPWKMMQVMFPALSIAFFSKSSTGTLPATIKVIEEDLGVKATVSRFCLPLCTSINMNGCAAFILATVIYVVGPEILFLNKFIEWIFLYNIYGLSGALFFLPKI